MALEELSYNGSEGSKVGGMHQNVIQLAGTSRQLLPSESGSDILFDIAGAQTFTLPTPVVGMRFRFKTTVAASSATHKVITKASTQLLNGALGSFSYTIAEGGGTFAPNGSSHVSIAMDGVTKGGLIGDYFEVMANSTTRWVVSGFIVGSGTIASPFATS